MRSNTIDIKLTLTEAGLSRFHRTPTFRDLLHPNQVEMLVVGDNLLTVNHTVWGDLQRVADWHVQVAKAD